MTEYEYTCDWCGVNFNIEEHGVITIHEKAPSAEYCNDELYNFCSYKCLRSWLAI